MTRSSDRDLADTEALADEVILAGRALLELSAQVLEELAPGIGLTGHRALRVLHRSGPQRLIDIATALDVTPTTATRVADRLAEEALVERVKLSNDRREVHLAIAPAGVAVVEEVATRRARYVASATAGLRAEERRAAHRLLRALVGAAEEEGRVEIA